MKKMVHLEIDENTHKRLVQVQDEMEKLEKTHQMALGMQGAVLLSFSKVIQRSLNAWEHMAGL